MINLTVEWMLPWRLLGISWTTLKTIGIPCISSAQPWGGSMRTTRAIEASAEILRVSGKRRKPLAAVTFRRSRDAEDLRRTQMIHRHRVVDQQSAKAAYWNPCRKHCKSLRFWRLLQKQVQPQLRTTRCEESWPKKTAARNLLYTDPQS